MKLPFFTRSDDEILLHEGIEVVVGGCEKSHPKKVIVHEPSMRHTISLFKRVIAHLQELSDRERSWADKAIRNPSSIKVNDMLKFKGIIELLENEIARIVDEDVEYVRAEMSPSQVTEIGAAWIKAVGIKRITELFFQLRAEFEGLIPSKGANIAPTMAGEDEPLSATH